MDKPNYDQMLDAGVHFGHLRRKWDPNMRPYIFMERKGIHIIDLNRTLECLEEAQNAARSIARSGKKILFVGTKKQAQDIMAHAARSVGMPYTVDRWLGGMMTNFSTIRRSIKKMKNIDRMLNDGTLANVTKKERLTAMRERDKLEKMLGGISNLRRLPHAMFIIDIHHEHIATQEANKLGITTISMVDTNSNPELVDFPVPGNDDASSSVKLIVESVTQAIKEGLDQREEEKAVAEEGAES